MRLYRKQIVKLMNVYARLWQEAAGKMPGTKTEFHETFPSDNERDFILYLYQHNVLGRFGPVKITVKRMERANVIWENIKHHYRPNFNIAGTRLYEHMLNDTEYTTKY